MGGPQCWHVCKSRVLLILAPVVLTFRKHWIEVDWQKHPAFAQGIDHDSIEEGIFMSAVNKGVLMSRGSWFKADRAAKEEKMFFRATFAAASLEKISEAIVRFGEALRAEFDL